MSDKKIYKKLPAVLQTTAIKNFFENTVEQLFSKANVENIQGYIGSPTSDDINLSSKYLKEPTVTKRFYGLSPTVNTINSTTGSSQNFYFYDELIDTLQTYGVDTREQNKIFSESYSAFLPPINPDKLINYAEYYWVPEGPSTIGVEGTIGSPIDIDQDIIGKDNFTPPGGIPFRNGMIVSFSGDYVIPAAKHNVEYVVSGVGDSITLLLKAAGFGTVYSNDVDVDGNPTQNTLDYVVQERGAVNNNTWSRVNFWYHKDNFIEAGDKMPSREFRADRPIIEFDRDLELFNYGLSNLGSIDLASTQYVVSDIQGANASILVDGEPIIDKTIAFLAEDTDAAKYLYTAAEVNGNVSITRVPDPVLNPVDAVDGELSFVPLEVTVGDVIQIEFGVDNSGREFLWSGAEWSSPQEKLEVNQAPLFHLYDTNGIPLTDEGVYPNSTFAGSKIFGYATEVPPGSTDIAQGLVDDVALGFPVVYRQFKASSEIVFENYQYSETYEYQAFGAAETTPIIGYYYYKLSKAVPEYHSYWKIVDTPSVQRIYTTYDITQLDVDRNRRDFFIGCIPQQDVTKNSGFDIRVRVNGVETLEFTYGTTLATYINFNDTVLNAGDFVEIDTYSPDGLISIGTISKFELPIGWDHNPENAEIAYTSEPEFLTHFSTYMEQQVGFEGDSLSANNFSNTVKDPQFATDIIQTNQDVILGTFLLDDQAHNLIDAIRFNAQEYTKYKNRVRAEIDRHYSTNFIEGQTLETVLEIVLKNVISYKVGKNVFNRTYTIPFGDNFIQEDFAVAIGQDTFVLANYLDLNKIENSMLVYKNNTELLCAGNGYLITNFNPITIQVQPSVGIQQSDVITVKLYDQERDSAQCPPTPSTLGLYPLTQPMIVVDESYQTPLEVIVGHDGSRTPTLGDFRDEVYLEFEKRIFAGAKKEFRDANSLPEYNINNIKPGAFRDTGYGSSEINDLLRHAFALWTTANSVDPVINEFYDIDNDWTWNYNPSPELPGHWKGVYLYYYDTIRPHTNPWEMLGFTEKPAWWDTEYALFTSDIIGRQTAFITYTPENEKMWMDIEKGIIRQGPRENVTNDRYLIDNLYSRPGLSFIIPVDSDGNLISVYDLFSTESTEVATVYTNENTGLADANDIIAASFLNNDGINTSYDLNNVYVQSKAIVNHDLDQLEETIVDGYQEYLGIPVLATDLSYVLPRKDLASSAIPSAQPKEGAVAILVNGLPLYSITNGDSFNSEGDWNYDFVVKSSDSIKEHLEETDGLVHYHTIQPRILDQEEWSNVTHSPIVGVAFDGFPIYGPYGYSEYAANGSILDANVTNVKSSFVLREGTRPDGPGGAFTGIFVEDYEYDANVAMLPGQANEYNMRFGITPDSNGEPINFYVSTITDDGEPMFPYQIGGGTGPDNEYTHNYYSIPSAVNQVTSIVILDQGGLYSANSIVTITGTGTGATADLEINELGEIANVIITNTGRNYTSAEAIVTDPDGTGVRAKLLVQFGETDNVVNNGYINEDATPVLTSTPSISQSVTGSISDTWKFGDFAPVEQAWTYSESYPFAVAEALLLAKPGRFATIFSDPTKLYRPQIDKRRLFNIDTGQRWLFSDPDQFAVHGDLDENSNFITNIGYSQFIHSWLEFQGLDTVTEFAEQMRTLNVKLAHRMSGYIDKDTLVARTDQYSSTGNASSLIIPQENIDVSLHSSPYKSRNFYSGVVIELEEGQYVVRGYDSTMPYFNVLESKISGQRESVRVGGTASPYRVWEPNTTYNRGTIVERNGAFYEAPLNISSGASFDAAIWTRLPALPQIGAAQGTRYLDTTGIIKRVDYETRFDNSQDVYNFLIELGR